MEQNSATLAEKKIIVPASGAKWKRLLAFLGPGYLVAVGYMDPGNWATDIAGGSAFGYSLLSIVLFSNLMAMLLQHLAGKLGIATGMDLAEACRARWGKKTVIFLWAGCQIAIVACDLAEVIGTAIALKLLFGLPLIGGVAVSAASALAILHLQNKGFRKLEAFVISLVFAVSACFAAELMFAKPTIAEVFAGFMPTMDLAFNADKLYLAVGILGATVMPHNLYLHSSIVKTRDWGTGEEKKKEAIRFATIDSTVALFLAFFVNASILIVAASFNKAGMTEVSSIEEAHRLLTPMFGTALGSALFGIALLASGQNSTITGTMAGQIAMEGFLGIKASSWKVRLATRGAAILPAAIAILAAGEGALSKLLVFSQVVLSVQLPFAAIPLVIFTSSKKLMGERANGFWVKSGAWLCAGLISGLNVWLLWNTIAK